MELKPSKQFKKDLKKYKNNTNKLNCLKVVLTYLRDNVEIPAQYYPHKLSGEYKNCMECHIQNDFLLIWFDRENNVIDLLRLGSHSELFK